MIQNQQMQPIMAPQSWVSSSALQAKRHALTTLVLFLLACAILIGGISPAQAQQAPANTPIGNQASATYVDTANPMVTLTSSSNTVLTTVSQVFSFTLTAAGAQTKPLGQQVCYPHTITNTGNGNDTITLNAPTMGGTFNHVAPISYFLDANGDGIPDNGTPITSTGSLGTSGPSSIFRYVVCANTPATGPMVGDTGTITVTATSSGAFPVQTNIDTTTIGNCSITLTKSLSSTAPPVSTPVSAGASPNVGPLFVVLNYTNSGTVACNNVILNDPLPTGFIYVPNSGRWSNSGMTVLGDGVGADPMGITYTSPTTAVTGTVTGTITSVAGSTSGNLYFGVTIASDLATGVTLATTNTASATFTDSITMTTSGPNPSNSVTYSVNQVPAVAFNGSATLSGIADGDPVTVATASPGQTIQWTNYVWNNGNATDTFDVQFLDGLAALAGTSASFAGANCDPASMTANACTFPAGTTFQLYQSDGMTTLLSSGGSAAPDTGPIPLPVGMMCPSPYVVNAAGTRCGYAVVVRATIPPSATIPMMPPAFYNISLQATSVANVAITDLVSDRLTALVANTVDLTNNSPLPGAPGAGATGMTVITTNMVTPSIAASTTTRFTLVVNNTGGVSAIYDLEPTLYISVPASVGLSTPPTAPVNWAAQFRADGGAGDCSTVGGVITSTGVTPIAPGASRVVCAEVIIPPTNQGGVGRPTDSPPGNYVLEYRVRQQGNMSVTDVKRDQITLLDARQVTITPNGMQQTSPGGSVTYVHTITNNGNVTENISFPMSFLTNNQSPTHAWSSQAYVDNGGSFMAPVTNGMLDVGTDTLISSMTTFTLAPNTSYTIFVRVNAPMSAGSPANVTTITANIVGCGMTCPSATDTTTLTSGLRLDKYQQLTSCTAAPSVTLTMGVPNVQWVSTSIAAGPSTAPGQCIAYLIVAANTTGNNINTITITDITPANTRFHNPTMGGSCTPTAPGMTTGPLFASVVPTHATSGTVTAVSAATSSGPAAPMSALLPGGFATLQFCVRINDM